MSAERNRRLTGEDASPGPARAHPGGHRFYEACRLTHPRPHDPAWPRSPAPADEVGPRADECRTARRQQPVTTRDCPGQSEAGAKGTRAAVLARRRSQSHLRPERAEQTFCCACEPTDLYKVAGLAPGGPASHSTAFRDLVVLLWREVEPGESEKRPFTDRTSALPQRRVLQDHVAAPWRPCARWAEGAVCPHAVRSPLRKAESDTCFLRLWRQWWLVHLATLAAPPGAPPPKPSPPPAAGMPAEESPVPRPRPGARGRPPRPASHRSTRPDGSPWPRRAW